MNAPCYRCEYRKPGCLCAAYQQYNALNEQRRTLPRRTHTQKEGGRMVYSRVRRHDYNIDGVFVRLVNCPIKGDHRQLAPTAEAWRGYAMRRWGNDVVDLTVTWDEHGRVTHNVEFSQEGVEVDDG